MSVSANVRFTEVSRKCGVNDTSTNVCFSRHEEPGCLSEHYWHWQAAVGIATLYCEQCHW